MKFFNKYGKLFLKPWPLPTSRQVLGLLAFSILTETSSPRMSSSLLIWQIVFQALSFFTTTDDATLSDT